MTQSVDIRADIAAVQDAVPGLHDAVSRAALASYAAPNDTELRRQADDALAGLTDADDRLRQLQAALPAALADEAEQAKQAFEADRQAEKDKLEAERDRIGNSYIKLSEKITADRVVLDEALLNADILATELQHASVKAAVYEERVANDTRRLDALADEHEALETRIANFAVTADEVASQAALIAEQAETDAADMAARNLRIFEEDTARHLAELHGNQMVDVAAPFEPETGTAKPGRWQRATANGVHGLTIRRKDLPAHEAKMAEAAKWYAENAEPYEVVVAADRRYYLHNDHITMSLGPVHLQRHLIPEFLREQRKLKAKAEGPNRRPVTPSQWATGAVGIVLAMPSVAEDAALWRATPAGERSREDGPA